MQWAELPAADASGICASGGLKDTTHGQLDGNGRDELRHSAQRKDVARYGRHIIAVQRRWRWDLNPRMGCPITRFRGVRPRPLGDSTGAEPTGARPGAGPPSAADQRSPAA